MNSAARVVVLLFAALLVAWQGVIVSVPHDHAEVGVPQEELLCSASHPSSGTFHLHGSGHRISPHVCLACLADSTLADAPPANVVDEIAAEESTALCDCTGLRSRYRSQLPHLRGPPLVV